MAEIPGPSENLGKSSGGDRRHSRLLADFLFGDKPEGAGSVLGRLRVDNYRRSLGMTEQERGLAEGIDTAKDWAPVVVANVGVAGATGLASYAIPEARPYLGGAAGVGFVAGVGIEVAANTIAKMEASFPRVAEVAKRVAASRVGKWLMMLSLSGGVGTAVGGIIDSYLMARVQAAQMGRLDAALYGHQANPPAGISETAWQARRDSIQGLTSGQPAEVVVPHLPQVPVDSGEAQLQAAEIAQQQLVDRLAVLNSGGVIGDMAKEANAAPWDIVRRIVGDAPHGNEIANALTRALGDKLPGLHEGAIRSGAEALGKVLDSAHAAADQYGAPYEAGGRAAVEAMKGMNSPEANALRAANMADMEAAAHVMEKVITPAIAPVLIQ